MSWICFQERSLAGKHNVDLTLNAFRKAYAARDVQYGLIFHSDQGSEYTAFAFRNLMDSLNITQSFSKKGYPFDNACCATFFKYLKKNRINRRIYQIAQELRPDFLNISKTCITTDSLTELLVTRLQMNMRLNTGISTHKRWS